MAKFFIKWQSGSTEYIFGNDWPDACAKAHPPIDWARAKYIRHWQEIGSPQPQINRVQDIENKYKSMVRTLASDFQFAVDLHRKSNPERSDAFKSAKDYLFSVFGESE